MPTDEYMVKGSTIRSKLDFVKDRFGEGAKNAIEGRFQGRGLHPLLTASWYPYELYVELLEAIVDAHFDGDASRLVTVGERSADEALKTVYRSFVRERGFDDFLQGIATLHHLFYNLGRIDVVAEKGATSCEIHQRDKPRYAEADLYIAAGFYQRAAELHGLTDVQCSFTTGPDGADFALSWNKS